MASAIRCVSSFFFTAAPRLLDASRISPASLSTMDFSARCGRTDAASEGQRKPRGLLDLDRHLVGRAAHSAGLHLEGWLQVFHGLFEDLQRDRPWSSPGSVHAPVADRSAVLFFPLRMSTFTNFAASCCCIWDRARSLAFRQPFSRHSWLLGHGPMFRRTVGEKNRHERAGHP